MTKLPARADAIPMSLIDVAETLGMSVALRLMQVFGGQEVKFPKSPGPDHEVMKTLGEKDGRELCHFLGGSLIYVPHGRARRSAYADVVALEKKGHDRREIAKMLGLSQRHVRRMANADPLDRNQPDLFDDV